MTCSRAAIGTNIRVLYQKVCSASSSQLHDMVQGEDGQVQVPKGNRSDGSDSESSSSHWITTPSGVVLSSPSGRRA